MSRHVSFLLIATAMLALGGCASTQSNMPTDASAQAQGGAAPRAMCPMCPMSVQGTQVAASDVEGGAALTFTTTTGDVEQLRAQVARMAERHNARPEAMAAGPEKRACPHKDGQACAGPSGMHGGMGMGMPMASAKASVEEVPGGARLVLKPEAPAQVDALREHVRRHAERMAKGGCACPGMRGAQAPGSQGS